MNRHYRLISGALLILSLLIAGCTAQPAETTPSAVPAAATAVPVVTDTSVATDVPAVTPTNAAAANTVDSTPEATAESPESTANEILVFSLNPGEGKARYRVREQLVNLSLPNDAVGETDQISGAVTILPDGTIDAANSRFEVNLSTLVSDQSRRDDFLRNNVLQTGQYPSAVFVPKSIAGLTWPLPESGEIQFQLIGDLTLRDVTKEVTWDVTGTLQDGLGTGQAVTRFTFADFNLSQPRVPVVLSIEDEIILEVDGAIHAGSVQGQ